jgi:hypothetical protein
MREQIAINNVDLMQVLMPEESKLYRDNAYFRRSVNALNEGADVLLIVANLCATIEKMQEEAEKRRQESETPLP